MSAFALANVLSRCSVFKRNDTDGPNEADSTSPPSPQLEPQPPSKKRRRVIKNHLIEQHHTFLHKENPHRSVNSATATVHPTTHTSPSSRESKHRHTKASDREPAVSGTSAIEPPHRSDAHTTRRPHRFSTDTAMPPHPTNTALLESLASVIQSIESTETVKGAAATATGDNALGPLISGLASKSAILSAASSVASVESSKTARTHRHKTSKHSHTRTTTARTSHSTPSSSITTSTSSFSTSTTSSSRITSSITPTSSPTSTGSAIPGVGATTPSAVASSSSSSLISDSSKSSHQSLSAGAAIGISLGAAAVAVCLVLLGLLLFRQRKQGRFPFSGSRGNGDGKAGLTRTSGRSSGGKIFPEVAWLYDPSPSPPRRTSGKEGNGNNKRKVKSVPEMAEPKTSASTVASSCTCPHPPSLRPISTVSPLHTPRLPPAPGPLGGGSSSSSSSSNMNGNGSFNFGPYAAGTAALSEVSPITIDRPPWNRGDTIGLAHGSPLAIAHQPHAILAAAAAPNGRDEPRAQEDEERTPLTATFAAGISERDFAAEAPMTAANNNYGPVDAYAVHQGYLGSQMSYWGDRPRGTLPDGWL